MHFADAIYSNGNLTTLDAAAPAATALAVRAGRIVAVGSEGDLAAYRGAPTRRIDLGGRTVTPGLIDAHLHPVLGVERTLGADLGGIVEPAQFFAALRDEATRAAGPGGWVRGWNLDYEVFASVPMTAAAIEDAVLGAPTLLLLSDGHTALASRRALQLAGIVGSRPFPDASEIVVDAAGLPTGALREESALGLVLAAAPGLSTGEQARLVRDALARLNASGITGGCLMDGNRASLDLLDEIDSTGIGLPVRLVSALEHQPGFGPDQMRDIVAQRDRHGAHWRGGVIKLFCDGVIDTGTGWLYEPDTAGEGLSSFWNDPADYAAVVRHYSAAGFQIATHAIGDRAIGAALDAYRAAGPSAGRAPHRIEHLECLADADLPRLAAGGITASVQPLHLQWRKEDGSDSWASRLGPERAARGWRVRDMIDSGALVALGSDWPVAQLDARIGMAWARLRRTPGQPGQPLFEPDQVLTADEALRGFTSWAARAQGDPDLGRLAVGCYADFAVWEENPLAVSADELIDVPVHATVLGGDVVHRVPDSTLG